MKGIASAAFAVLLGGCALVSEKPVFTDKDVAPTQLAEGLWAVSGPGCEVTPQPGGKPLPECALPMTVIRGRMTVDFDEWMHSFTPGKLSASPLSGARSAIPSGAFLLIAGDPLIVETLPPPDSPTSKTSYLALRILNTNNSGQIDRAIMWPVTCPDRPNPGLGIVTDSQGRCTAQSAEAVRAQAPHMKPFMSYFLTWVRLETPPTSAVSSPSSAALALARRWRIATNAPGPEGVVKTFDPAYLAIQSHIAAPRNDAMLVQAAREAVAAASPGYQEAQARVLAEAFDEDSLRDLVAFEENPVHRAESKYESVVSQRRKALAQIAWPRYRALFEASLCKKVKCAAIPSTDPGAIKWKLSNVAQPSIDAAELYLQTIERGRTIGELTMDELAELSDEKINFLRANPTISRSIYDTASAQASAAVEAQLWPEYRRQIVLIYASLFTAEEVDAMSRYQKAPGASAMSIMEGFEVGRLMGEARRSLFADIKTRYCQKVACP